MKNLFVLPFGVESFFKCWLVGLTARQDVLNQICSPKNTGGDPNRSGREKILFPWFVISSQIFTVYF